MHVSLNLHTTDIICIVAPVAEISAEVAAAKISAVVTSAHDDVIMSYSCPVAFDHKESQSDKIGVPTAICICETCPIQPIAQPGVCTRALGGALQKEAPNESGRVG